jgi:hypothetical protein
MPYRPLLTSLLALLTVAAAVASATGIFSAGGPGYYEIDTWRDGTVILYGEGIYRHMSADVAIQGIAQDYVTLFVALPLLWIAWWAARRGSLRYRLLLAGVVGYFLVTYLFYLTMGMYNILFLLYTLLLATSFFSLLLLLLPIELSKLPEAFSSSAPVQLVGGFLVFNAIAIGILWLGVVAPPLLDGTIYPPGLDHYTTLIVQGLDLGLLLPLCLVLGLLLRAWRPLGLLGGTVYIVFLALLMTALTAKLMAMGVHGVNTAPAIYLIPVINLLAIIAAVLLLRKVEAAPRTK